MCRFSVLAGASFSWEFQSKAFYWVAGYHLILLQAQNRVFFCSCCFLLVFPSVLILLPKPVRVFHDRMFHQISLYLAKPCPTENSFSLFLDALLRPLQIPENIPSFRFLGKNRLPDFPGKIKTLEQLVDLSFPHSRPE